MKTNRDEIIRLRIRTVEKRHIEKWASRRDLTMSEFVRRACRHYVASMPLADFYDEQELYEKLEDLNDER